MNKLKLYASLFWSMFKIGLFTFGGGYAMIAVIEREIMERKNWINSDEFTEMVALAESTPGPLAINFATYIGYKKGGVLGSIFSTIGVVVPSLCIIFLISLFFDKFLSLTFVGYAFKGIQACVAFLIISAGIKLFKKLKKTAFNITLFIISTVCLLSLTIFAVSFSTVFYVLIGGAIGVFAYGYNAIKTKIRSKKVKEDE